MKTVITIALLAAPTLVSAEEKAGGQGGAWRTTKTTVEVPGAGITLPIAAGGVSLTQTNEFSNKGKGIDDVAQFKSPDAAIFVTAYIYRPTYADAALTAFATSQAIDVEFGGSAVLSEHGSVAFGGQSDGAIRRVYTGGRLKGDALTTAAAFARVGGWIVKLRASGPAARQADVVAALDAYVAGTRVDEKAIVYPAAELAVDPPCPAPSTPDAVLVQGKNASTDALFAAMVGGSAIEPSSRTKAMEGIAFPANGARRACLRGTVKLGQRTLSVLQPAGETAPTIVLLPFNDAGGILGIEKALLGTGYVIKTYAIGAIETRGSIDRLPTIAQLEGWLTARGAAPLAVRSRTVFDAKGSPTINIDPSALK